MKNNILTKINKKLKKQIGANKIDYKTFKEDAQTDKDIKEKLEQNETYNVYKEVKGLFDPNEYKPGENNHQRMSIIILNDLYSFFNEKIIIKKKNYYK